jgi:hypothetical protein
MSEATLIFPNMRGGCATVGNTVHTLFRLNGRRPGLATLAKMSAVSEPEAAAAIESNAHAGKSK